MSFLKGRLAGAEGSYFLQESKQAVTRFREKNLKNSVNAVKPIVENSEIVSPDVLPEILRHSLPPKIFSSPADSGSSISKASKWALKPDPITKTGSGLSAEAISPLRGFVSLPQVTLGPKKWQIPDSEHSIVASTANDLRQYKHAPINPEKLKAAAAGLSHIGSAFAAATAIVFGGATLIFGIVASKLEVQNSDDLRSKGKDLVQPKFDTFKEKLAPLRTRAEAISQKWHLEKEESVKENPLIKELSEHLDLRFQIECIL